MLLVNGGPTALTFMVLNGPTERLKVLGNISVGYLTDLAQFKAVSLSLF